MSPRHKRILKVGCSGVIATAIDFVMLLILVELFELRVVLAVFLAASSGAMASFVVNKFWAFGDASRISLPQVASFIGVALGSAFGVSLVVQVLSVHLGLPYLLAKSIGAVLLFAGWTYPVQSRVVFPIRVAS
jgi:putative flippase GtrA